MKDKISFDNSEIIHLKLNGSFDIRVVESDDFVGMEYECESNDFCITKENNGVVHFNSAKDDDAYWNSEMRASVSKLDFKNGFLNFLESTKPLVETLLNRKKSQTIQIKLLLKNHETKQLVIEADNANIDLENVVLQNLSINADNCSIKSNHFLSVPKIKICSDNLKATIHFGEKAPFWNISSDNASVHIIREKDFNGKICVLGDNRNVSGKTRGDGNVGLCDIKADNVKVKIEG